MQTENKKGEISPGSWKLRSIRRKNGPKVPIFASGAYSQWPNFLPKDLPLKFAKSYKQ